MASCVILKATAVQHQSLNSNTFKGTIRYTYNDVVYHIKTTTTNRFSQHEHLCI